MGSVYAAQGSEKIAVITVAPLTMPPFQGKPGFRGVADEEQGRAVN